VIFFHREARFAQVGDVLFQGSIGRTDFPRGNHQDLLDSITQKLWPLGDDVAFVPGHGPMSTFGVAERQRKANPFVAEPPSSAVRVAAMQGQGDAYRREGRSRRTTRRADPLLDRGKFIGVDHAVMIGVHALKPARRRQFRGEGVLTGPLGVGKTGHGPATPKAVARVARHACSQRCDDWIARRVASLFQA
jgi:hypothetical protein